MDGEKKFHVRIYDNYYDNVESEGFEYGQYETYAEARKAAEEIVDRFLNNNWAPWMTEGEIMSRFTLSGEEPVILPNEHGGLGKFSARVYLQKQVSDKIKNPGNI